jgi:PLP dependent protein
MKNFITDNVERIQETIASACHRAGREQDAVRIIAVTKSVDAEVLLLLADAGIRHAAENRWQVAREKFAHPAAVQFEWHFIGSLQTNKVKYIVPHFTWVHSVDRVKLAEAISQEAIKRDKQLNLLLQVNVAEEPQKHGFHIDEVDAAVRTIQALPNVRLRGLMTMAPLLSNAEEARPVFRRLHGLLEEVRNNQSLPDFEELSMGMSDDYKVAVEEGATMVRIGRQLVQLQGTEGGA